MNILANLLGWLKWSAARDRQDIRGEILDQLADKRVFALQRVGDGFGIYEKCDGYYGMKLTPAQLLALSEELRAAAMRALR